MQRPRVRRHLGHSEDAEVVILLAALLVSRRHHVGCRSHFSGRAVGPSPHTVPNCQARWPKRQLIVRKSQPANITHRGQECDFVPV